MKGKIIDITDENVPKKGSRPAIFKKIVTVDFLNKESAAIEFTGALRDLIIKCFKVNDIVDVEFITKAHKNKKGKLFNNKKAVSIKRVQDENINKRIGITNPN